MYAKCFSISSVLPQFTSIQPQKVRVTILKVLDDCYNTVDHIISTNSSISWDVLYDSLMIAENELQRIFSPIAHLYSVEHNNLELRKVYEESILYISEYKHWITQHYGLYQLYQSLYKSSTFHTYNVIQQKTIKNILRDFKLSGVFLSKKEKKRYKYIMYRLSQLYIFYVNNVFDATLGWEKIIADKAMLSGIPDYALEAASDNAIQRKIKGWLFTLQYSSYAVILTHCDTRELREELYWAFNTRASDQGPNAGKWDNTIIMDEILSLRYELARILGFNNYLQKSLVQKMVRSPEQIFNFLIRLYNNVHNTAQQELLEIKKFAKQYYACHCLKPWDVAYYREKQKQYLFAIQDEELRYYFPESTVLEGMFLVVRLIYNITVKQRDAVDVWNPDVRFFDIYDNTGEWRGGFYLDIYARDNKCEGAWMDEFVSLMYQNSIIHQRPIAYLVCNFVLLKNKKKCCLLTHSDIITLFHEFGHVLYHIMTKIDARNMFSFNNGIPQDVIELPSQMMEKFCWDANVLRCMSKHFITKKSLDGNIINNLLQIRTYQTSSYLLNQVIYGLFDLRLHCEYLPGKSGQMLSILNELMQRMSIYPVVSWDRFSHSFIHIFSNDYAAGYYSYLWSEMLVLNLWKRFQDTGILNANTGKLFLENVLESGIFINLPMCLVNFCGEKITIQPMLQYYNIPMIFENFVIRI